MDGPAMHLPEFGISNASKMLCVAISVIFHSICVASSRSIWEAFQEVFSRNILNAMGFFLGAFEMFWNVFQKYLECIWNASPKHLKCFPEAFRMLSRSIWHASSMNGILPRSIRDAPRSIWYTLLKHLECCR